LESSPQLSVIIVNHRAEAVIPECLKAIAQSDVSLAIETIVIDNPPSHESLSDTSNNNLNIKRIPSEKRLGFAAACNLGARNASGDFFLFLNPDVIPDSSAIRILYRYLTAATEEKIVTGRLIDSDGNFQASCRRLPTLKNLFHSRGSILSRLSKKSTEGYTLPDYPEATRVEAAAAAMMMMSRETFGRLGGFDDTFFMYMEDTDLCYRAGQTGVEVIYIPDARGTHYWGYSTRHYRFRRIIWHHRSLWRYFMKHNDSAATRIWLFPMLWSNCFLSLILELFTLRK